MAIAKFTDEVKVHENLPDQPNDIDGYSAEQMKELFDRPGVLIKQWLNEVLLPGLTASNLAFTPVAGINAQTVQEAIENVQRQAADATAGSIPAASISKEKLTAALLDRIYGGKAWVSLDEPTAAENVSADFPVGQLWVCPSFTMANKGLAVWSATNAVVTDEDNGWKVTGSGTAVTATVSQSIYGVGAAGDRVVVNLEIEDLDVEASGVTVELNGVSHDMVLSGRYETVLNSAGGLTVAVNCTWPAVSLAAGSFRIRRYAVVNVGGLEAQMVGCHGKADWPGFVAAHTPFVTWYEPKKLFMQDNDGQWYQIVHEVFPVERGGTGHSSIAEGQLLYGTTGGGFAKLDPPDGANPYLGYWGGKPQWGQRDEMLGEFGALRSKTGAYDGNGANSRTINLGVAPKLLYIYDTSAREFILLMDGARNQDRYDFTNGTTTNSYIAYVGLSGSALTFDTGDYNHARPAVHFNKSGAAYKWVAIY